MRHSCVQAKVSGRVQGVGFRMWTKRQAEKHGLEGWVRNLPDGSVEALIQGEGPKVEALLADLRQGPPASSVDTLSVTDVEPQDLPNEFQIKR